MKCHLAQAINYLEIYGLDMGLLINFRNTSLQFAVYKPGHRDLWLEWLNEYNDYEASLMN